MDGTERELTFGEIAVGYKFNPSGNQDVMELKSLYARIIDIHHNALQGELHEGAGRHHSIAITDAETAQMRSVKAATWGL